VRIYNRNGGILPPSPEAVLGKVEFRYEAEGNEDLQQGQRHPPPAGGLGGSGVQVGG
jgi:hypothetical protein